MKESDIETVNGVRWISLSKRLEQEGSATPFLDFLPTYKFPKVTDHIYRVEDRTLQEIQPEYVELFL